MPSSNRGAGESQIVDCWWLGTRASHCASLVWIMQVHAAGGLTAFGASIIEAKFGLTSAPTVPQFVQQ